MLSIFPTAVFRLLVPPCAACRITATSRLYSLETKYSNEQKEKIIDVLNESDKELLSKYDITKGRIKQFSQWKNNNGTLKALSDVELIEGFSERTAKKLFDSILKGPAETKEVMSNKIRGQILQPNLSSADVKNVKSVLTVNITVNSVSWTLINKDNYEVMEWKYYGIDYPEGKKFQITDILDIAWDVTNRLPIADIYVMKAEATSLRAAGSDPNNPKVLAVNLQRAQMVAMIVALINARDSGVERIYGTLVGNERVSTDQTVEMLLQTEESAGRPHVPDHLKDMFRSQKDLQKDMLGQCLLLSLTFMDLCVYKNMERIAKLLEKRE